MKTDLRKKSRSEKVKLVNNTVFLKKNRKMLEKAEISNF